MKIKTFVEPICCDECDSCHVHFECPECKHKYADSQVYSDFGYVTSDIREKGLECGECGAEFEVVSVRDGDEYNVDEWEWKQTKGKVEIRSARA
jgi:transcription elongation factor Elf1